MFAVLSLHLHRLFARRKVRIERAHPERVRRSLQFCAKSLPALLDAEWCNIFVCDPSGRHAWIDVGSDCAGYAPGAPSRNDLVERTIVSGRTTFASECRDGAESAEWTAGEVPEPSGAVCVPVRSRYHDDVIGAIEVRGKRSGDAFGPADAAVVAEAAECVRDLVDSVYLGQDVYGATETVLEVGEWSLGSVVGLLVAGALLMLMVLAAMPSMHLINDALGPLVPR